jgi:hypothetical protein
MNVEDIITRHEKTYGFDDVSGGVTKGGVGMNSKGRESSWTFVWVDRRKLMPVKEIMILCNKQRTRLDRERAYQRRFTS